MIKSSSIIVGMFFGTLMIVSLFYFADLIRQECLNYFPKQTNWDGKPWTYKSDICLNDQVEGTVNGVKAAQTWVISRPGMWPFIIASILFLFICMTITWIVAPVRYFNGWTLFGAVTTFFINAIRSIRK